MFDATASTDRLIGLVLKEDKDVLKQLLTTDKVVAMMKEGTGTHFDAEVMAVFHQVRDKIEEVQAEYSG